MFIDSNKLRINIYAPYESEDGTRYVDLTDPVIREKIGVTEIPDPECKNEKYYYVQEIPESPYVTNTPKDFEMCKLVQLQEINTSAYTILVPSDWMVVKELETGTPVATTWKTWRQSIRDTASQAIVLINACTNIDELAELVPIQWPNDPDHNT
jgi:hypothetical protein